MLPRKLVTLFGAGAVAIAMAGAPAQAATVTFDFKTAIANPFDLHADSPGIQNGNCGAKPPCLAVNKNGAAVLSILAPLTFSVTGFWLHLQGAGTKLIVKTDHGTTTFPAGMFPHNNGGQVVDLSQNTLFQGVTYVSFLTNKGTARIDNLTAQYNDIAPVPLPAAGFLLAGALAGLAALRRRRTA